MHLKSIAAALLKGAFLAGAFALTAAGAPARTSRPPAAVPQAETGAGAAGEPAQAAPPAAAAPAAEAAAQTSPGERFATALLNAGAMATLMDTFMQMMPRMYEEKFAKDPGMKRLSTESQARVRTYMTERLPVQLRGLLDNAATDATRIAGPRLLERYTAEDLDALSAFFESPVGVSILQKIFLRAGQTIQSGSRERPSTAELLSDLSGAEIRALALFVSSPGGELFQKDSNGMFKIVGNAFGEAVNARREDMEELLIEGLCQALNPAEIRQMRASKKCPPALRT